MQKSKIKYKLIVKDRQNHQLIFLKLINDKSNKTDQENRMLIKVLIIEKWISNQLETNHKRILYDFTVIN